MWNKIEKILEIKGMTEEQLMERVSAKEAAALKRIKKGKTKNPSFSFVNNLARILDVPIDDLRPDDY